MTNTLSRRAFFARTFRSSYRIYGDSEVIRYRMEKAQKNPFDGVTTIGFVFILLLFIVVIFTTVGAEGAFEKNIIVDDEVLAKYTQQQYDIEFSEYTYSESNILLVFLFDEDREKYVSAVKVGNNVAPEIAEIFQGEKSFYNKSVKKYFVESWLGYYGMEEEFNNVMTDVYDKIQKTNPASNLIVPSADAVSYARDTVDFLIYPDEINTTVEVFATATGIPTVVVFENMENIFEVDYIIKEMGWIAIVFAIVLLSLCIAVIVLYFVYRKKRIKEKKEKEEQEIREKYGASLGEGIE